MRGLSLVRFLVLSALIGAAGTAAAAERKVALVIGNSEYNHAAKLPNTGHDATAMAFLLKDAGFEVVEVHNDIGASEFRRVTRLFGETARTAEIALFYYAGHGMEVDGANYLVPTDARLATDLDVEDEVISLDRILRALEPARRLRLVILDACRDNPFLKKMKQIPATRSIGRGLARVDPANSDTLVAFAAKAGSVAADGQGRHSPFTEALLKHLATPGLDIRFALGRVRDEVLTKTGRRQEPFVYGSLGGATVTLLPAAAAANLADTAVRPQMDPESQARRDYELAERVATKEAWDLFLSRHQFGFLAELARAQRAKLSGQTEPTASDPKVAALPSAGLTGAPNAAVAPLDTGVARDLQIELKRVGCDPRETNGMWGVQSRRALDRFNTNAGTRFDVKLASHEALDAIRDKRSRVCPLSCGRGSRAQGDECVRSACRAGEARGADGNCQSRRKRTTAVEPSQVTPPRSSGGSPAPSDSGTLIRCGQRGCRQVNVRQLEACRRKATAQGLVMAGSDRRQFVRTCMGS